MSKRTIRKATLLPDGNVEIVVDSRTTVIKPYSEDLHESWPDLERPKKTRKKRVSNDDAEGDAGSDTSGSGVHAS